MVKKQRYVDHFGFTNDYQYNRRLDYPQKKPNKNLISILIIILIVFASIILLSILSFSGYIAWNSFTNDPVLLKLFKTYIAIIFAPIFLTYNFLKSYILKLPKI